jgi:GDPmannose 4,6-dehydratase
MQWLMLQQEKPEDFVIATGEQHSVREFVDLAALEMDITVKWRGEGVEEEGCDSFGNCIIKVDPNYFRPTEVDSLLGDSTKARIKLGWRPKTTFRELVSEMVRMDLKAADLDKLLKDRGHRILQDRG